MDRKTWSRAQDMLRAAAVRKRHQTSAKNPSPLAGRIFDETGDRLTPSHAGKGAKRHRYYVSRRLIERSGEGLNEGWRLPAPTIENAVIKTLSATLLPRGCIELQRLAGDVGKVKAHGTRLEALLAQLQDGDHILISKLIKRIDIAPREMQIALSGADVAGAFDVQTSQLPESALRCSIPFEMRRRGVEAKLVIGERDAEPDEVMIKAIARSTLWLEELREGVSIGALAANADVSKSYVRKMLKLAYLSPAIIEAIVRGRQPVEITLEKLVACDLPLDWSDQARALGFNAR